MRIGNLLQYTENHRYYTFRDFSLSSLDYKMLSLVYQPMIGGLAIALFHQLYYGVPEGSCGYSGLDTQRKLLLGLGLEMNERGRRQLIEQCSMLEAVGLLQTSRVGVPEQSEFVYEYELLEPLSPGEFFRNLHLTMLLRDKIGKYPLIALREMFGSKEPDELAESQLEKENISVPFYEIFRLNAQSTDNELEQALSEVAPARQAASRPPLESARFTYGEIIMHFPRMSGNRKYVEKLRTDADQLTQINYVAYKFNLKLPDVCYLLDEEGIFLENGELLIDELQLRAAQLYRQDQKRQNDRERVLSRSKELERELDSGDELIEEHAVGEEHYLPVPSQLDGRCDVPQYNMLMRNEPRTKFLQRFFPGTVPDLIERLFERIEFNYRLPEPVINVLIHYVIGNNDSKRLSRTFVESVAANMLVKQVDTFEKAIGYLKDQEQVEADKERRQSGEPAAGGGRAPAKGGRRGSVSRKPAIPVVQSMPTGGAVSPEELEELRKLARELDGNSSR
ncbi:DnaD domain protein [Paenibacillus protaetiae]|uniref:Helicase DnaB n=1 Tax=Paenibacillus protaetiae TaxID=2509456 RepID=A0A4P6F0U2_9BACL|nr:DnaD domain protein [Paenibacillus protaetiae]QAY68233.1 helicase DnaB [Paenibacillus protaetiae]